MIQSKLGEVKITRPNYDLCDFLSYSKEDVDTLSRTLYRNTERRIIT